MKERLCPHNSSLYPASPLVLSICVVNHRLARIGLIIPPWTAPLYVSWNVLSSIYPVFKNLRISRRNFSSLTRFRNIAISVLWSMLSKKPQSCRHRLLPVSFLRLPVPACRRLTGLRADGAFRFSWVYRFALLDRGGIAPPFSCSMSRAIRFWFIASMV